MYFYPASPATLDPTLASTRGHFPTWALTISAPASPPTARSQPPTCESPISIPASQLPAMILYPPLVPTAWISLPASSHSLLPVNFLPGLPKVVYLPFSGSTMNLSCDLPPISPSRLRILQILAATLPTAPRLPAVSLYRSLSTALLMPPAILLPRASPTSFLLTAAFTSP